VTDFLAKAEPSTLLALPASSAPHPFPPLIYVHIASVAAGALPAVWSMVRIAEKLSL